MITLRALRNPRKRDEIILKSKKRIQGRIFCVPVELNEDGSFVRYGSLTFDGHYSASWGDGCLSRKFTSLTDACEWIAEELKGYWEVFCRLPEDTEVVIDYSGLDMEVTA